MGVKKKDGYNEKKDGYNETKRNKIIEEKK
jgi:hypothetical protein